MYRFFAHTIAVASLGFVIACARPAAAANINTLRVNYSGPAHSLKISDNESSTFALPNIVKGPNSTFTSEVPDLGTFSGKVSNQGKVTFKAKVNINNMGQILNVTIKGTGFLSVNGRFLDGGSITVDGKLNGAPYHDKFTFSMEDQDLMVSGSSASRSFLNLNGR
jgi:hypothetical protein